MYITFKFILIVELKITGITVFEIILSFISIQTIFSIFQAFLFYFVIDFLLLIQWKSSLLLIVSLDIAIGICGMSIGNYLLII